MSSTAPRAGGPPPGLQPERTGLAWRRTALALATNGVLVLLHHDQVFPTPVFITLGVFAFLAAVLVLLASAFRRSMFGRDLVVVTRGSRAMIYGVAAATTALSLAILIAIVIASVA